MISNSPTLSDAKRTGAFAALRKGLEPPPDLTPTQWSAENFVLSAESSAEPGRFNPHRAAFQPGMLDVIVEPGVKEYVFKCSAQVTKTTTLLIHIGYTAHLKPAPILFVTDDRNTARAFATERLSPSIRDVSVLSMTFYMEATRPSAFKKPFLGGFLAMGWARNPTTLRMRAIKLGLADEVDAYDGVANKEGDPLWLLKKRGTTFFDFIMGMASTPREKGRSRIARAYEESDQRRFFIDCPECKVEQYLKWSFDKGSHSGYRPTNILWEDGKPETARYACEHCGSLLDDLELKRAVRGGRWKATKPFKGIAGFHVWELYSPWSSLPKIVEAFEYAEGYTDRLMTFVNTVLGEEWEGEVVGTVDVNTLLARREEFDPYIVPERAALLTAAVDMQHDRIEVQVEAWGLDDERWILTHIMIPGDPNGPLVWEHLEEQLTRTYRHALGRDMWIEVVAFDSGGHHAQKVYDFCAVNILKGRLWWPIKGVSGFGKPIWRRSEAKIRGGIPLYLVGVDDAKTAVAGALAVHDAGPNFVHLPMAFAPDRKPGEENRTIKESLKRLTAEKCLVTVDKRGFPKREWLKPEGARNEEWDCAVYNLAARKSMAIDNAILSARLEDFRKPQAPPLDGRAIARMFKR